MLRLSPSLLDSFAYYLSIEDAEQSELKRQELIAYLRGERVESEAMQKGSDFEAAVIQAAQDPNWRDKDETYTACVKEIEEIVSGSISQHHVQKTIGGVLIHGYLDFLKYNRVYDVKTTRKYEVGKYRNRLQHRIYLSCLKDKGITEFTYLVTDFRNVYQEDYSWIERYERDIQTTITEFMGYLANDIEMREAFYTKDHGKELEDKTLILRG